MSCTLILSRTEATPECTSLRSCSKDFSIWAKRSSACERTECQQEKISISQKIQSPTINLPPNLPGCSFQLTNASVSCLLFQASIFQGCLRRQSKFHQKLWHQNSKHQKSSDWSFFHSKVQFEAFISIRINWTVKVTVKTIPEDLSSVISEAAKRHITRKSLASSSAICWRSLVTSL